MCNLAYAIMAGLMVIRLLGAAEIAPDELEQPLRVRFHLADGVRVTGNLTSWTENGIDGSFGRREWIEIDARDVWILYRRLMDLENPTQWVDLGRTLLLCALEQNKTTKITLQNAEKAFARARKIDPASERAIQDAREDVERTRRTREELQRAIEEEKLRTLNPEANEWTSHAWPDLTQAEQNAAIITMRQEAMKILEQVGMDIAPVETEYFLFYSDMPRRESAKWARQLDHMYTRLTQIFHLEDGKNLFWGKAVIFVFNEQDTFRLVEAQAFNYLSGLRVAGLCHMRGPMVFVNFYRQTDDYEFAAVLVHETSHGFMHRFLTPKRLPTWANEGFADYLASVSFSNSPVDRNRRQSALKFVRNGGDVAAVLNMSYLDETWPGPDSVGYPVSYLLVSLMIMDRPRRFGDWVKAVKHGKDWRQALVEDFGVDEKTLIDRFVRYYRVND